MRDGKGSIFPRGWRMIRDRGWSYFLQRSQTYLQERFLGRTRMYFFRPRFARAFRNASGLEEATDVLYSFRFLGLTTHPFQQRDEILAFMKSVERLHPSSILEIGTGFGGTILLFSRIAARDALIIGLDLPPKAFTISCPKWREPLLKDTAVDGQKISILRGNSHDDSTLRNIIEHLGECKLDVLFVDGDHTYDGVKKDFETYSPLVRKGGIVGFHDIVPHHERPDIGVPQLWRELKACYRWEEFSVETDRNGIGVIYFD